MKDNLRINNYGKFMDCLREAAKRIDQNYFQLQVQASANNGNVRRYRERVYCYELYHQLRCLLGDGYPYRLMGEVDKSGNSEFGDEKPDFIVHEPGNNDNNLIVIEVKPIERLYGITKDIETLKKFVNDHNYFRGIMYIYGYMEAKTFEEEKERIKRLVGVDRGTISLLHHRCVGMRPELTSL